MMRIIITGIGLIYIYTLALLCVIYLIYRSNTVAGFLFTYSITSYMAYKTEQINESVGRNLHALVDSSKHFI